MKLDVRLEQTRSCIVLKDAIAKNFVASEHHSFTSVFTFSVVVVDLSTDCILTFLFPAETDVLVPVFSQSTDVVVVNFVVVLKFPSRDSCFPYKVYFLYIKDIWFALPKYVQINLSQFTYEFARSVSSAVVILQSKINSLVEFSINIAC